MRQKRTEETLLLAGRRQLGNMMGCVQAYRRSLPPGLSCSRNTQAELGAKLGVSRRTAQRWARHGTRVLPKEMADLVALVHPYDADLARELATTLGQTLEGLGVVPPPAPALPPCAPPVPLPPPPAAIVDAVVCAAAEAMNLTPRDVRRGLHAAFARAHELGLSVGGVVDALTVSLPEPARVGAG
jgi:hypothetical protein